MMRINKAFRIVILLGVFLLGAVSLAAGASFTYQSGLLWGGMMDAVISGRHVFCAMHHGLMILDIADPASPTLVSQLPFLDDYLTHIAVSGNYAYLGTIMGKLVIVDISDVSSPQVVGYFGLTNWVSDITVSGTTAYVCDKGAGLRVIDVSDPTRPTELGYFSTSMSAGHEVAAVQGNYAYVASWDLFWILDVTDPTDPQQVCLYHAPDRVYHLEISGSTAYLAVEDSGLVTIDISDPANPVRLASLSLNTQTIYAMGMEDNYLFMAIGGQPDGYGVKVIDISDPSQPTVSGQAPAPAIALNVSQGRLFATNTATEYELYDISNPEAPQNLTVRSIPANGSLYGQGMVTDGKFLYIPGKTMGLVVVDNSDPSQPVVVSQGTIPNRCYDLELRDRYLYSVDDGDYATEGLKIVDVYDPNNPVIIGSLRLSACKWISLSGNYAFVGGNIYQYYLIDISDPTNPVELSTCAIGVAHGFANKGHYLYISCDFGLVVADISDPTNPVVVDTLTGNGPYDQLLMYKGYLLAGISTGFQILDVTTDPLSPTPIAFCACPADDIKPYGDYLFVSNSQGLTLVDMVTPEMPVVIAAQPMLLLESSAIAPYYNGLAVYDDYGLSIFQVSMPSCCTHPGDANYDQTTNMADVVYLINYIFKGGSPLLCPPSGDANGDCDLNIGDAVYLIDHIFKNGDAPVCGDCP